MRTSVPGSKRVERRNLKSNQGSLLNNDKKQPSRPPHDPNYDMQYGCSRKTGCKAGGHFWNPPDYCESRIFTYGDEPWVNVGLCKECYRHKSKTCPAASIPKVEYVNGLPIYDEPCNRKPKRVERHVAARQMRDQVRSTIASLSSEPPRRKRML